MFRGLSAGRVGAMRVLGLMSGTSADGVDAVLAEFRGRPQRPRWRLLSRADERGGMASRPRNGAACLSQRLQKRNLKGRQIF
jgi:1,6-anhydro-N-acetylmuramate kinase